MREQANSDIGGSSNPAAGRRLGALPSPVRLMVVGTPRSGTTLLQRMVSETCGLATVPETHLFTVFAPRLLRSARFPLGGDGLLRALERYVALPQHRGGAPGANSLYHRLDGRAETLVDVLNAVVADQLDDGQPGVEKTPDHLLWVRYLAPMLPETRFLAVVRDPRAVFASSSQVHWGRRNAVMAAERWSRDQRRLLADQASLGPERFLLVRYEDLVGDEEGTRSRLVAFAGSRNGSDRPTVPVGTVFRRHEAAWKSRTEGPVTTERIDAWGQQLAPDVVADIEAITGPLMDHFGYQRIAPRAGLGPGARADRMRYRLRRQAHELRIHRQYAPRGGLR